MKPWPLSIVVCESTAAIVTHLRKVTDQTPINLGGHPAPFPLTLCGTQARWDTKLPLASVTCSKCRAATVKHP